MTNPTLPQFSYKATFNYRARWGEGHLRPAYEVTNGSLSFLELSLNVPLSVGAQIRLPVNGNRTFTGRVEEMVIELGRDGERDSVQCTINLGSLYDYTLNEVSALLRCSREK